MEKEGFCREEEKKEVVDAYRRRKGLGITGSLGLSIYEGGIDGHYHYQSNRIIGAISSNLLVFVL